MKTNLPVESPPPLALRGDSQAEAGDSSITGPAPASPAGAELFARALLQRMAANSCDMAKGFIEIGRLDLAREHLIGAFKQLSDAEYGGKAEIGKLESRKQEVIEV